jgi:type I restriction enzyme S subunit
MSKKIPLRTYAKYVTEKIHSSKLSLDDYVTTDNLLPNKFGLINAVSLPAQKGNVTKFLKGDILISNIRPYLKKIWYATKSGGCSVDVIVIRAKDGIDSQFLYYSLFQDDFFTHAMNGSKGTKMPRGDKNQLMEFTLTDLNKSDQEKIADLLSSIDKKIELNNRINTELEAMAKALYDYWFVQFDFPDTNGKPYKSSGGKMVYNPALKREIPKGWKDCKLEKIIKIYDSRRIPLSARAREKMKGQFPYYGATSIMDYINDYIFDGEYVLLAEDGSVMDSDGFPVLQYIFGKTWVNNHAHVLEASSGFSNPLLHLCLKKIPVVNMMSGSIQKKINQDNLRKTPILHPPAYLLKAINPIVNSIYSKLIATQKENNCLANLRDWLLPILMNGQITVK